MRRTTDMAYLRMVALMNLVLLISNCALMVNAMYDQNTKVIDISGDASHNMTISDKQTGQHDQHEQEESSPPKESILNQLESLVIDNFNHVLFPYPKDPLTDHALGEPPKHLERFDIWANSEFNHKEEVIGFKTALGELDLQLRRFSFYVEVVRNFTRAVANVKELESIANKYTEILDKDRYSLRRRFLNYIPVGTKQIQHRIELLYEKLERELYNQVVVGKSSLYAMVDCHYNIALLDELFRDCANLYKGQNRKIMRNAYLANVANEIFEGNVKEFVVLDRMNLDLTAWSKELFNARVYVRNQLVRLGS